MKKWRILIIVSLIFGLNHIIFAQEKDDSEWVDYVSKAWKGDFHPFIEGTYGYSAPFHKTFSNTFKNNGMVELKMGHSEIADHRRHSGTLKVVGLDDRYLLGSYYSRDLNQFKSFEEDSGNVQITMPRFGIGQRMGYGYGLGSFSIIPYNQNQFNWAKLESVRPVDINSSDADILDRYEGSYRFSVSTEAGVKVTLFNSISVTGAYELGIIYPRVIFWEWLGSYTILYAGIGAVSYFSESIVDSSPVFGPLMYFLLKNGAAYAFYTALQSDMNWPFPSETPLTYEAIKISASITF